MIGGVLGRRLLRGVAVVVFAGALAACGGGGNDGSGGGSGSGAAGSSAPAAAAGSTPSAAAGDPNVVPVYIDGGPAAVAGEFPNVLYATIQVCAPGGGTCATIDHVMVDTGSSGLRLLASAIGAANPALLAALPQQSAGAGGIAGECEAFADGVTWGGIRSVDLHWSGASNAGDSVPNLAAQIIGDPDARLANIPGNCSGQGALQQDVAALGANGILGIGLFAQDCGTACAQMPSTDVYYGCSGSGTNSCTPTVMPVAQQVPNPVALMPGDNNGSLIVLPGGGIQPTGQGLLVLGIGTRANNTLPPGSAQLATDDVSGYFQAVFNGNTLPESYFDSGSSANFMPSTGLTALPDCASTSVATGFLCPGVNVTLTAQNSGAASTAASANVLVINALAALTSNPAANVFPGLAADGGQFPTLDLGIGFFLGRTVATLIEGQSAPGFSVAGPAFAYSS